MDTPCRRWDGYHRKYDGRPMSGRRYAYRVVYEREVGPLPSGMIAHHVCENSWCVEPAHLEFITQGEHLHKHGLPGDWGQALKTHCPRGHEYSEENTYTWRGERHCKECRRSQKQAYRARVRQARRW